MIILDETITYKKPKRKVKLDIILQYFRVAPKEDIIKFKKSKRVKVKGYRQYIWFSDFSGSLIENKKLVQCDHIYPDTFRQLAYNFIKNFNLDIEKADFIAPCGLAIPYCTNWVNYHRDNCKLQIVTAKENKELWLQHREKDIYWLDFYNI